MALLMWNAYRTGVQVPNNSLLSYEKETLSDHMIGGMMGLNSK